jgi:hypothetical protein
VLEDLGAVGLQRGEVRRVDGLGDDDPAVLAEELDLVGTSSWIGNGDPPG